MKKLLFLLIFLFCFNSSTFAMDNEADDIIEDMENGLIVRKQDILPDNQSVSFNERIKRKARQDAVRLEMKYSPEIMYFGNFIDTTSEAGSRNKAGFVMSIDEDIEVSVLNNVSWFALKSGDYKAGRESLDIRVARAIGNSCRPWFEITPYQNFEQAYGTHIGAAFGFDKVFSDGTFISLEAFGWKPWDEGYYTIIEDGQKSGATLEFMLPLHERIFFNGRANYETLILGGGAKSGIQYAGDRYGLNGRGIFRLFEKKETITGYGFRDEKLWNENVTGSNVDLFANLDFRRYNQPGGFTAFHPVKKVWAQTVGVSTQLALSPHIGISGEAYIGGDYDRKLNFGEIAGFNTKVMFSINPELRIWGGYSYSKTNANIASGSGYENQFSIGINYNF